MPLEVLFGLIFRIFVVLEQRLALKASSIVTGEVVAVHTGLERSLVAEERRTPRVILVRVRSIAPRAVLPYHAQVREVEGRGLCVADIRLGPFLDQNPARGGHPRRRADL